MYETRNRCDRSETATFSAGMHLWEPHDLDESGLVGGQVAQGTEDGQFQL